MRSTGEGRGVVVVIMDAKRVELVAKSKSNTFINMNIKNLPYWRYCLSSHFTIRYYLIFPQKCKSVLYFLHLLGLASRKVHVNNRRSNTDYDPQKILLHRRIVNKIG